MHGEKTPRWTRVEARTIARQRSTSRSIPAWRDRRRRTMSIASWCGLHAARIRMPSTKSLAVPWSTLVRRWAAPGSSSRTAQSPPPSKAPVLGRGTSRPRGRPLPWLRSERPRLDGALDPDSLAAQAPTTGAMTACSMVPSSPSSPACGLVHRRTVARFESQIIHQSRVRCPRCAQYAPA